MHFTLLLLQQKQRLGTRRGSFEKKGRNFLKAQKVGQLLAQLSAKLVGNVQSPTLLIVRQKTIVISCATKSGHGFFVTQFLPFASVEVTTAKPQEMHVYFGVWENEKERHSNESLIVVAKSCSHLSWFVTISTDLEFLLSLLKRLHFLRGSSLLLK